MRTLTWSEFDAVPGCAESMAEQIAELMGKPQRRARVLRVLRLIQPSVEIGAAPTPFMRIAPASLPALKLAYIQYVDAR